MSNPITFRQLGLDNQIVTALEELGYESPTPVQEESIPLLLAGHDLSAKAQTGTGKTAAFALPVLNKADLRINKPQALIIAPTRELAIQVAEACQSYSKHLDGFHVAPIYGGQDYKVQLKALKRGVHVVVGTPGRVMDHIERGSLKLDAIQTVVLDEADEMLRMGFVDDVEWILKHIPHEHQTALFSATMPKPIMKIAKCYLKNPEKVNIAPQSSTVDSIRQCYMRVSRKQKMEALTRYFDVEDVSAAIIFVRTKTMCSELAEKLQARGYAAAALNGDMNQAAREKVVNRLKKGSLDIVVATDVAARGIDVERISHVINYDIPYDVESYIHRIGRTGRAGREGVALLFVSPREQSLLRDIEKTVGHAIEKVTPPSVRELTIRRDAQVVEDVLAAMVSHNGLESAYDIIDEICARSECEISDVAAVLAYLMQEQNPLPRHEMEEPEEDGDGKKQRSGGRGKPRSRNSSSRKPRAGKGGSSKPRGRKSEADKPRKKKSAAPKGGKPKAKGGKKSSGTNKPAAKRKGAKRPAAGVGKKRRK